MEGAAGCRFSVSQAIRLIAWPIAPTAWVLSIVFVMIACFDHVSAQERRLPLIFVPGIFGSKLCEDGDPKKLLWGSVSAWKQLPLLKLDADGRTSKVRVAECGIIDEFVYFGSLGQDVYGRFIESLSPDYKVGTNLFVFSYDWRLSSFENADRFEAAIERYAKQLQLGDSDQFAVVAHSMGGLIVTLSLNRGNRRISKLVTVSTPFQGSAEVLPSLEEGWGWLQHQFVSMDQVRETVLSFPAIYELFPTYRNCCALGNGRPGVPLNMASLDDVRRVAWMRSLSPEFLKSRLDPLVKLRAITMGASPIPVAHMYGTKQETPEQIYLSAEANPDPNHLIKKKEVSWLGDGTVIDYSAKLNNDLGRLPGGVQHDKMMSDPRIIEQIKEVLADRAPPDRINGAPLATCMTLDGPLELDGATLRGAERVVTPGEDVQLSLTVRSSVQLQNPSVLGSLTANGLVVSPAGTHDIEFNPVDGPIYGDERATDGTQTYFYAQKFVAMFKAPQSSEAKVEFRCNTNQTEAVASWDFRVAQ